MERDAYKGYLLWGHAIPQQTESPATGRYAASGTIVRENKFVEASGVIGVLDSEQEALDAGLAWARAWVDTNG